MSTEIQVATLGDVASILNGHSNADGTLKVAALQAALGGSLSADAYKLALLGAQARHWQSFVQTFDFYVDSVNGSDAAAGTDPSVPWQTLAKVTSSAAAGKKIGLKRGSTFLNGGAVWAIPFDNMTIGAYGPITSPKPIISIAAVTAINDLKNGTNFQDVTVAGFSKFGIIRQPTAGLPGGAYRRLTILGPAGGAQTTADGINWSNGVGGVIEDCDIRDCWNGLVYGSGGGGYGIKVSACSGLTMRYNRVATSNMGISVQGAVSGITVHHNRVLRSHVNGIDVEQTSGTPTQIFHNFVHHRPDAANAAGHGISTQLASIGPIWRNNIVVSDYAGAAGNVELYCLSPAISSLPGTDVDYNLGWIYPGSAASYGKINTTIYADLASFQAALAAAGATGAEAHSISADPLIADLTNEFLYLLFGSPALGRGVILDSPAQLNLAVAGQANPNMGPF